MRKFKTESKRLLDLMINSIYTNREIFLRELISNASDSLDKLYMRALTDGDTSISRNDLQIKIDYDDQKRTLTISDNGIGMTDEELEKNLGTIAHSGSLEFKSEEEAQEFDDIDIIGQFGVGFYSAFMVADKVTVITHPYGSDEAFKWESDGVEGYTIGKAEREERGTDVILQLRENAGSGEDYDMYLMPTKLKNLVKHYSDYVRYPIRMLTQQTRELPRPEDAGDDYTPQYETYEELETLNSMVPIWTRKKSEVTEEEYQEFYKAQFHDPHGYERIISLHAEGTTSYHALLFIPKEPPMDLYSKEFKRGLALYSSSVMIMEQCEDLLPDCFGFVRGVVDSADLNLNISREMLQHDRQLKAIEKRIEKKVKQELADMRDNDRDAYVDFYNKFAHGFKFAIYNTFGAKSDLLEDLLLFYSAKEEKLITLDEYCNAADEEQKNIYFATGNSVDKLAKTPSVKAVMAKGYDVLLCDMSIDEFCLLTLNVHGDKEFKNVASGDLGFETDADHDEAENINAENYDLFNAMRDALDGKVVSVKSSMILTDAASCITTEGDISLSMERYFQTLPNRDGAPKSKRVLELNTQHPVFETLKKAQEDGDEEKVANYAQILYGQALLAEGLNLDDPEAFNNAVLEMMK